MHSLESAAVVPDRITEEWRDGLERGQFLIQFCKVCGIHQYYPREHCMASPGSELEWVPSSGRGVLYTYTVVRRTPNAEFQGDVPYVLGIVDLEEGVRITTRISGVDADRVTCGMPVSVRFGSCRTDLPYFVPDDTEETIT